MAEVLLLGSALYFSLNHSKKKSKTTKKSEMFITKYKDPNSYSKKTKQLINMITAKNDINPVGSQKFKIHRYPGDIDLFEPVKYCCSLETALNYIVKDIKKIGHDIKKTEKVFLGDFKAGLDERYFIDHGEISSDYKVENYNKKYIITELNRLKAEKLLSSNQVTTIIKKLPSENELTPLKWSKFHSYYKDFYTIRWKLDELIKGVKKIGHNGVMKNLTLKEALQHNSIVKIDIWGKVNERFLELTNFFLLTYKDRKNKEHVINMKMDNYIESLIKDIKLYSEKGNSMKMTKRAWALASSINDKKLLVKLYPLYSSSIGMLYQLSAEIETLILMTNDIQNNKLPLNDIINQIDDFKMRLSTIYDLELDEKKMFNLLDEILKDYERNNMKMNVKKMVDKLTTLMNDINITIEEETLAFLKKNKLQKISTYFDKLLK
jgi:hypothetical protein